MKKFTYKITNPAGFHASLAGLLVKYAQGCSSEISISSEKYVKRVGL